ncbi:MAG: hypothetical protein K8F24_08145 [Bacteroidales bacterium]|nr:hypothetical protein [Bacteroidales bacterium]
MSCKPLTALVLPAIMALFSFSAAFGNQKNDSTKVNIDLHGFVSTQLFADSRQIVESREHMLSLYPKKRVLDADGKDMNAGGDFNQLSMTSRLRLTIQGPEVLGAKPFAVIEGDFTGASNFENNSFRLREAYIQLQWEHIAVLAGQYWHPINTIECRPLAFNLNTGAPFHPFSRHNQIRVTFTVKKLKLIAVAASQRDFVSSGPQGASSVYMRDAKLPNLHLQLQYQSTNFIVGAGVDYKKIKPEKTAIFNESQYVSDAVVNGFSAIVFGKYEQDNWTVKTAALYGQNLSDHLMLGGYYEHIIDTVSHTKEFTATPLLAVWTQVLRQHRNWNFSVFVGYTENLTYNKTQAVGGVFYGRNDDIKSVSRIMPRVSYRAGAFELGAELEYTSATYGTKDNKSHFTDKQTLSNTRLLLSASYFF